MINFWSYKEEYKKNKKLILNIINKTLKRGNIFFGDEVKKFEKSFAKKYKSKYAVAVGSGTDAILIALKAISIKPGDEIITAANTAIPTISAIRSLGGIPRLVDIDNDYLMNIDLIEREINNKTKAIIPVHLYGQTCQMDKINNISRKYKIKIIEDCAQSQGAKYKGKYAGTFGVLGCFSFYPTKILGAYGDGGLILTNDKKLYLKAKRIRFYGIETLNKKNKFNKKYYANEEGINSRLDEIQSSILNYKMKRLNKDIFRRRLLAKKYIKSLSNTNLTLPIERKNNFHVYHLFTVFHIKASKIIKLLKKNGIETRVIYPYPIQKMTAYKDLIKNKDRLKNSLYISTKIFCLPLYPEIKNKQVNYIINKLKKILDII